MQGVGNKRKETGDTAMTSDLYIADKEINFTVPRKFDQSKKIYLT